MAGKLESLNAPAGHFAARRLTGGILLREIISQSYGQVMVKGEWGESLTWRKLDLIAVVPPDEVEKLRERLQSAQAERDRRRREAEVSYQIKVRELLKGRETWVA